MMINRSPKELPEEAIVNKAIRNGALIIGSISSIALLGNILSDTVVIQPLFAILLLLTAFVSSGTTLIK